MAFFKNWFNRRTSGNDEPDLSASAEEQADSQHKEDAIPVTEPDTSLLDQPRWHHYSFVHIGMRMYYFKHPGLWIEWMMELGALQRIRDTWDLAGNIVLRAGKGEVLSSEGLGVSVHTIDDVRFPIITLPQPRAYAEAYFIAMVPPCAGSANYRYFVLEKANTRFSFGETGVMCEWYADESRRNHELYLPADAAAFAGAIIYELRIEANRAAAGQLPETVPAWNPNAGAESKAALDALEANRLNHFRTQHCLVGFKLLPEASALHKQEWAAAVDKGDANSFLLPIWEEAARLCSEAKEVICHEPVGLSASRCNVAGRPALLITMPEPIGAPEPYFLLIMLDQNESMFFTLEYPAERYGSTALLCGVDFQNGNHAVFRMSDDCTPKSFIRAIERHLNREDCDGVAGILPHLSLYSQVYASWAAE